MNIGKERKFLFDHNNFDLPDTPPEPEVYIEPPPIFSLEDMGHARDAAFEKGRAAGLEEARISREQYIAGQTETVIRELKFLLGAETYRAAVYEREAVALTETIFKTVFPHFAVREGLAEITSVISKVVADHPEKPSIAIELPEGDMDAIKELFTDADIDFSKVSFSASSSLTRGSCRMYWKDGGALRDQKAVADEILRTLQQAASVTTAAPLANRDEKDETQTDSPAGDATGD